MRCAFAFFFLLTSCMVSADTIYKCTGPDGRLVFSDKKCQENAERIDYQHPESWQEKRERESREHDQAMAKMRAETEARRAELQASIAEQNRKHRELCSARHDQYGLKIGMSRGDLINHPTWGYPDSISQTTTAGGTTEYFVYECEGYGNVRLHVTNGFVDAIHK